MNLNQTIKRILPSLDSVDESENPLTVIHFTNKKWDWYIIAGEPISNTDFYFFGLVKGYVKELGFFTLNQIIESGGEYDVNFTPIGVYDIFPDFDLRKKD